MRANSHYFIHFLLLMSATALSACGDSSTSDGSSTNSAPDYGSLTVNGIDLPPNTLFGAHQIHDLIAGQIEWTNSSCQIYASLPCVPAMSITMGFNNGDTLDNFTIIQFDYYDALTDPNNAKSYFYSCLTLLSPNCAGVTVDTATTPISVSFSNVILTPSGGNNNNAANQIVLNGSIHLQ